MIITSVKPQRTNDWERLFNPMKTHLHFDQDKLHILNYIFKWQRWETWIYLQTTVWWGLIEWIGHL